MRGIFVIINPISGVGSKAKIPSLIASRCAEEGVEVEFAFTEYGGHAAVLTRTAVAQGYDSIIAVGGDGTVNEVAKNLLNSDVALGIIPKGSGNGLARELDIPMDVRRAVDVVFSEHASVIDACSANEHIFFCTCGFGFDAAISADFALQKRRGSLTYLRNIVEEYLSYKPEVYELQIEGLETIKEKAFLITCANASQYGNNAFIAPHADISDGRMDVTILSPFTALDIGPLAFQLFTRTIDMNSKIRSYRVPQARIIRQSEGVMHVDGEPVMAGQEVRLSVIGKALKVYTPENPSFVRDMQRRYDEFLRFFERIIISKT